MKQNNWIKTAMIVCAAVLIAAVVLAVTGVFSGAGFTYENSDKYTSGETDITLPVRNLDVNWIEGLVEVKYHAGDAILVRETSQRTLRDNDKLRWWVDGDTLRIQYAKSGIRLSMNLDKQLVLTLPESLRPDSVSISAVSADIKVPQLYADRVTLSTVSGSQTLSMTEKASSITMSSVSGSQDVSVPEADKLTMEAVSGSVRARIPSAGAVRISTVSGSIRLETGNASQVNLETTSGSVTAALPEDPGFTAHISTVSGRVDSALALTRNGNDYSCGDGSGKVTVSTVSGSVRLEAWQ